MCGPCTAPHFHQRPRSLFCLLVLLLAHWSLLNLCKVTHGNPNEKDARGMRSVALCSRLVGPTKRGGPKQWLPRPILGLSAARSFIYGLTNGSSRQLNPRQVHLLACSLPRTHHWFTSESHSTATPFVSASRPLRTRIIFFTRTHPNIYELINTY